MISIQELCHVVDLKNGFVTSWENVLFTLENIGTCVKITWNYFPLVVSHMVGWLVVLRINVDLAIFQPYLDLEAGDNQSLKIQVVRPGIEPRSSCSASQELNHLATAAPHGKSLHPLCARFGAVNFVDFYIDNFLFAWFIFMKDGKAVNCNGGEVIRLINRLEKGFSSLIQVGSKVNRLGYIV